MDGRSKDATRGVPQHRKVPVAGPRMRIGLLGGSFNPAHAGHRHISLVALAKLGLDQVWWLVSPGNPLKDPSQLPSLKQRVAAANEVARHPRIVVTGFEEEFGFVHTIDTIRLLKRRFPQVQFVWLMGADNLAEFHRWRAWEELFALLPIAVFDRPGFGLKARAGKAARRFASAAVDDSDAAGLALIDPPAWTFLTIPLSGLSSTGLRGTSGKDKSRKEKAKKGAKKKDQLSKKKNKGH
jgi:nicotinate-nucleotide adenylyltransferase